MSELIPISNISRRMIVEVMADADELILRLEERTRREKRSRRKNLRARARARKQRRGWS